MSLPRHVAIIMDGNGRWAKRNQLPRIAGHHVGVKTVRRIVEHAAQRNIKYLSLFAFGKDNWQRPGGEVKALMSLFMSSLKKYVQELHQNQIRLQIRGDLSTLSPRLRDEIAQAELLTRDNNKMSMIVVMNYSGRWDIVQAAQRLQQAGGVIDETTFAEQLLFHDIPDPELMIRTSGEERISNFMLWQLAYTELYFTDMFWPDFTELEFDKALAVYAQRDRRFGKTAEQLKQDHYA